MKRIWLILGLCALFNVAAFSQDNNSDNSSGDDVYYQGDDEQDAPPADQSQQQDQQAPPDNDNGPVTYQTFYDQLSPYGQWVNTPEYGNVWVPNNQNGFTPYLTDGYWVYTDYGWTWVSDDAWGWGPYHYGRWYNDPVFGWGWVPGYDWAPAWVTWGDYGGYYCWAPIWPGVVVGPHYRPDARYWNFIPHDHIGYRNPGSFVVRPEVAYHGNIGELNAHINFISHASTFHQSVFFAGPKANDVERYTGTKITAAKITTANKPGATKMNGSQVTMYRPAVARTNKQPAPANVRPASSQPAQRTSTPTEQQRSNTTQQRSNPVQQRSTPTETHSSWTPPRQPATQSAPAIRNNFIPSAQPAQHFSSPAPAARPSFGGGGGGGGGFHGGGGGGRR